MFSLDAGHAVAHLVIDHHVADVGVAIAATQRSDDVHIANVVDIGDVHDVEVIAVVAPPGTNKVARTSRNPADGAEAHSDANSVAKAEERNVRRRINRTIAWCDWSRPPDPGSAMNEPAAVM